MSGNDRAKQVYLMQSPEWVKVGISDDPTSRRRFVGADRVVKTWMLGSEARLVEAIVCRLLKPHLCGGYEYFDCSIRRAEKAVETAIVMVWRGQKRHPRPEGAGIFA